MLKLFTICLFFILTQPIYTQEYIISQSSEGIYKIKSPYNAAAKLIYIKSYNFSYSSPTDSEGYFFLFKEKNIPVIISDRKSEKIRVPNFKIFENYDFIPKHIHTVNKDCQNSFITILDKGNSFKEQIHTCQFKTQNKIIIELQNLTSYPTTVVFDINNKIHSRKLSGNTSKSFEFQQFLEDGNVNLKIVSLAKVGLENIRWNSDSKTLKNKSFGVYSTSNLKIQAKKNTIGFYFEDGSLNWSDNLYELKTKFILYFHPIKISSNNLKIANEPNLECSTNLIIYNEIFKSSISELRKIYASTNNYSFVDVQEIYNHYSCGQKSVESIKKFIFEKSATSCLLIGDSSYENSGDLIPSYQYQTNSNTWIFSDHYYSFYEDPLSPSVAISRLPFNLNSELKSYISKIYASKELNISKKTIVNNIDVKYKHGKMSMYENLNGSDLIKFINKSNPPLLVHIGHGNEVSWGNTKKTKLENFRKIKKETPFRKKRPFKNTSCIATNCHTF